VLSSVVDLFKVDRSRRYYVKSGYVAWGSHSWDQHPAVAAVIGDEGSFLRETNEMALTVELGVKLPTGTEPDSVSSSDLILDAAEVFEELQCLKVKGTNDNLILKIDRRRDFYASWADENLGAQGILATVFVTF
jgi:hypothetical protein